MNESAPQLELASSDLSLRELIAHIRARRWRVFGDKLITALDLYDLLLHGDTSGDRQLLPGDVISIPPVGRIPGDTIVVPLDTERVWALPLWQAVTMIICNLAVAVLAVRSA